MKLPFAEPYKIKMVEPIQRSTREERIKWIEEAHFNLFNLRSDRVYVDLLTDSGTGAMSDRQWAALMRGDESYAGSASFYELKKTVKDLLGFDYVLPTHQGRAAENVLFSVMVDKGDIIPGNAHFDTTKGHIEFREARALDCTIDISKNPTADHPFKGNVDIEKLEEVIEKHKKRIPFIIVTVTCNTAGGQPVSLQNLRDVSALATLHGIPVVLDSARFAENAYFIKQREEEFSDWSIGEIVREMFDCADAMTMSSKKDAIVNIGGFIAMRDEELYRKATVYNVMYEGFNTYGGLAGRDMAALAEGLKEGTRFETLEARIKQVAYLGDKLKEYGIPILEPYGGHAIFLDAERFLPQVPKEQFIAQTLAIEIYLEGGVRGVEIGTLLADRDPDTGKNRYPELELVRLAIPRRAYTNSHMDYVAAVIRNVYEGRNSIETGLEIVSEAPIMRHFTVELKRA